MKKILSFFLCALITLTSSVTTYAYSSKKVEPTLPNKNIKVQHVDGATIYSGTMLSPDDTSWISTIGNMVYGDNNFKVIDKKSTPITPYVVTPSNPDDNTDVINTIEKQLAINPRAGLVGIAAALAVGATIIPLPPLQALCAAGSVIIADKASSYETTYEYIVQYTLQGANGQISYAQSIVTYKNSNRTGYITSSYHWWQPS